ncbi:MAG: PAS domain S-box protein [Oxalobacteraceae bacterium]|nr:MAG: PAS domain S-box protein [Oxalobacteraceae bacterium]
MSSRRLALPRRRGRVHGRWHHCPDQGRNGGGARTWSVDRRCDHEVRPRVHGHGARGAYTFGLNHGAGREIIIAEGCIIHSSSAAVERVFGYSEHEVVSRNVRLLTSADHRSRHDSYVERYLTTSERPIIGSGRVLVGQRTDGTGSPMELSVGEAERAAERIFTGFIRDLTTQQRFELRLVHPDQATAAELAVDREVE